MAAFHQCLRLVVMAIPAMPRIVPAMTLASVGVYQSPRNRFASRESMSRGSSSR
jgi:hypothetical protein